VADQLGVGETCESFARLGVRRIGAIQQRR
jgi:hypothetical protein